MAARDTDEAVSPTKNTATTIAAFTVGLAVIAIVLLCCISAISHELKNSIGLFMREVAEVESENVNAALEDKLSILHGASSFIVSDNIGNESALLDRFREMVDSKAFARVGIVYPDGKSVGYDSEQGVLAPSDYSGEACVQTALRGDDFVAFSSNESWDDGGTVVFAVPIYDIKHRGGNPIGTLVGTTSALTFSNAIDASLFEGTGSIDVIDSQGTAIFSSGQSAKSASSNVAAVGYSPSTLDEMEENLARGIGGSAKFTQQDGTEKIAVYEPVGINDWFVSVELPTDYLEAKSGAVLAVSLGMAAFIVCVTVLLMATVFRTKQRGERALARAALIDDLTGIGNALAFNSEIAARRHECCDRHHSLALFNLVGFSLYNTIFGYERGSALLRSIAAILADDLRRNELAAHLSGDRFVMLIETADPKAVETKVLSLMDRIDEAIGSAETHYRIVSQCCLYRLTEADRDKDINLIIQDMAIPFCQAKKHTGERIVFFDECNVADAMRVRHIEGIMSTALLKEEFVAYFQPQYDIRGGEPLLCGAEALVRWNSPILGLVKPDEFIPIFERNGFVDRVDRYMLERACIRLRQWMDAGLSCVPVSVNLSRQNLFSSDLISRIERTVDSYGIPHDFIELELTEGIVAESIEQLVETANKLRERGFRVAMDDFGTGYSALSILKDVPFDTIKLDRAFFGDSIETERGRATLTSVIQLLDYLGFEIIAEGIETEDEALQLKEWGCHIIQGFVYGRPVPADEFLKKHLARAQDHLDRA